MTFAKNSRSGLRAMRGWALAAALALPAAACDSLLDVDDPDVASPGSLNSATTLPVQLAGAIGDFQAAYTGTNFASNGPEGIVNLSAIFSDEYQYASTFPTRLQIDLRSIERTNSTAQTLYRNLQTARASAERASAAYLKFQPTGTGRVLAHTLAGMSYVIMAETYCNGVPFGSLDAQGNPVYGPALSNVQMYELAIAKFDSALALANDAGTTGVSALARVGKGRALLNLGRFADAAAAVSVVPTSFVYLVEGSENTGRQQNGIFVMQSVGRRVTVTNREGGNGLPFATSGDPRVPSQKGVGSLAQSDQGIDLILQRKYTSRSANTPLATGAEARLIEAEAALRANDVPTFLAHLNSARATGQAALTDPGTNAGRVDLLFQERAYALWLTAHRTGDLRRLVRQYGRPQESVFPNGTYFRAGNGNYGTDVNFPIPVSEDNIPGFTGCADRNA